MPENFLFSEASFPATEALPGQFLPAPAGISQDLPQEKASGVSAPRLSGLLRLSHAALASLSVSGEEAAPVFLDATAGNGHDTLFLARMAGPDGLVIALDRQREALEHTAALLASAGLTARVKLICGQHGDMADLLASASGGISGAAPGGSAPVTAVRKGSSAEAASPPRAAFTLTGVVFNLGFLPGGNKAVVTDARSTVTALDAVWPLVRVGGLLSVHTYTGHPGAREEAEAVAEWMAALPWKRGQVTACRQHNKGKNPETLFLAFKQASATAEQSRLSDG